MSVRILSLLILSLVLGSNTFASERASRFDQIQQIRVKIESLQNMRNTMADQLYNISDEFSDPQMYLGDYLNRDELEAKKQLVALLSGEAIDLRIQYMRASTKSREMSDALNKERKTLNDNFEKGNLSGSAVLAEVRILEKQQEELDSVYQDISDIRLEIERVSDEVDELNREILDSESPARQFNNLAMK